MGQAARIRTFQCGGLAHLAREHHPISSASPRTLETLLVRNGGLDSGDDEGVVCLQQYEPRVLGRAADFKEDTCTKPDGNTIQVASSGQHLRHLLSIVSRTLIFPETASSCLLGRGYPPLANQIQQVGTAATPIRLQAQLNIHRKGRNRTVPSIMEYAVRGGPGRLARHGEKKLRCEVVAVARTGAGSGPARPYR